MTLKDKLYELYKKVYKTNEDPTLLELTCLVNVIMQAAKGRWAEAERKIGKDVLDAMKQCTVVHRRSVEVDVTKLFELINKE